LAIERAGIVEKTTTGAAEFVIDDAISGLRALRERERELAARHQAAVAGIDRAREERLVVLVSGVLDPAKVSEADQVVVSAQASAEGLIETLGVVRCNIEAAEADLAVRRDRLARTEAAQQERASANAPARAFTDVGPRSFREPDEDDKAPRAA
jgi:hypothetical protein